MRRESSMTEAALRKAHVTAGEFKWMPDGHPYKWDRATEASRNEARGVILV